jgi:30S ribosomal protein S31
LLFLSFLKRSFYKNNKFIFMGRGDAKTKKGKIFSGSFGKSRPAKPAAAKKAAAKKKA